MFIIHCSKQFGHFTVPKEINSKGHSSQGLESQDGAPPVMRMLVYKHHEYYSCSWFVNTMNTSSLYLPSGKRLHNYGKSQFLMEKITINGHVQVCKLLVYQRVTMWITGIHMGMGQKYHIWGWRRTKVANYHHGFDP